MILKTMDAGLVRKCFLAGAAAIQAKKEYINELNVFPVPDGDTGTNMTMTITAAADEVSALENADIAELCRAISGGSLRGARGNSGVILSQLFRGFTRVIREVDQIDGRILIRAFEKAVDSAYKAVMKPKEGTILTVARAGAEKAAALYSECEDIIFFMDEVLKEMRRALDKTPEQLPVLKEAGVVDSGGEGLVTILEGMYDALCGKEITYRAESGGTAARTAGAGRGEQLSTEDIRFGYCTEFIIMLEKDFSSREERELKSYLEGIGDSIVCVADEDIVKIHVHTNDPGLAIQKGLSYGQLSRMKIDNMREEHNERFVQAEEKPALEEEQMPRKEVGFISVSTGEGIGTLFRELGVDVIIEGGQTMNPSTEDFMAAVEKVNADTIFVFPNNSNILLAANQAKALVEDKQLIVIPTKNIPQGITAMIHYVDGNSAEENEAGMLEGISEIRAGQVTYAVRDTSVDGMQIRQGDIMGLYDKAIKAVGSDVTETAVELAESMLDADSELVTLYYGEETPQEDAGRVAEILAQKYEGLEVETEYGGQPIYYYYISVE